MTKIFRRPSSNPGPALKKRGLEAASQAGPSTTVDAFERHQPSHYSRDAPWPAFRGPDLSNSGCQPTLLAKPFEINPAVPKAPVHFITEGPIFSTPIIGNQDLIYVGSADKNFYAFDPVTGKEVARFRTQECIDSAGALHEDGTILVPSCDGSIYKLNPDLQSVARYNTLTQRPEASLSSIYWNEANVVVAPNNMVIAGNDDFYLHACEPDALERRWVTTTGLNVWSAPCFDPAGNGYGASCDATVFRFDPNNGKIKWRTRTSNLIAASPAYHQKKILIGNFSGHLLRLNAHTGRIEKTYHAQAPIYASIAIAPDETAFIGSCDGLMHWVTADLEPIAQFYTGDAIRSSAAIGPDPENKSPYLVYFGSGNGHIYALEPDLNAGILRRRWSYDTRRGRDCKFFNINASIALGEHGIATASADCEVIYVPYHAYLASTDKSEAQAFNREPSDGFPQTGRYLEWLNPGGAAQGQLLKTTPMDAQALDKAPPAPPRLTQAGAPISLRLLARDSGRTMPAQFDKASIQVNIEPPFPYELHLQPSQCTVSIMPTQLLTPGALHQIKLSAQVHMPQGSETIHLNTAIIVADSDQAVPTLQELLGREIGVCNVSVHEPSIVATLDQIGLASQRFRFRIIDVDPSTGKFSAWGVLRFGASDDGEAIGVIHARVQRFAFSGEYKEGWFSMEAQRPWFEITAWPMALDRLRMTGFITAKTGQPAAEDPQGGSLFATLRLHPIWSTLAHTLAGRPTRTMWAFSSALSKQAKGLDVPPEEPSLNRRSLFPPLKHLALTARFAWSLLGSKMAQAWGAIDEDLNFRGLGAYDLEEPLTDLSHQIALDAGPVQIQRARHSITAKVALSQKSAILAPLGILLLDRKNRTPLPIDYNTAERQTFDARTQTAKIKLRLNRTFQSSEENKIFADPARIGVVVLLGTQPVANVGFDTI